MSELHPLLAKARGAGAMTLALRLAETHQKASPEAVDYRQRQISRAAAASRRFLEEEAAQIEGIAQRYAAAPNVYVLGSGPNAGTAEEASLKLVEMAKLPSEAQDLENFLHGRLREVDRTTPLLFVAPCGLSSRRVLDFLTVIDHVVAPSVVLTGHLSAGVQRLATHVIRLPDQLDELATPLLYITPLYLLAYHLAHHRGYDPVARRYPDIVPQKVRYGGVLDKQPG